MQTIIVDKKNDGKQLDNFLYSSFSGLSSNTFFKALRQKDIRINDIRTTKNISVHTGDEIKVFIVDELLYKSFIPEIIYEDINIIIINKPNNIEVVGENSLTSNLKMFLKTRDNVNNIFLEPCHRLDRNTKGLIIFAKNIDSLEILLSKFQNQEIEKHYIAKVYGIPKLEKQTLTAYLFKDNKKSLVYISDIPKKGYIKIITSYKVLEKYPKENYSVLDVTLHTGKTHQIRAHLSHIGHPILGDGKYGINKVNKHFGYKTQQLYSYILKFNFRTDSGILNYLNGKEVYLGTEHFCN